MKLITRVWGTARVWRYIAVGAVAFAMGGTGTVLATNAPTLLASIVYNGNTAHVDASGNLAVNDSSANNHLSNIDAATANTSSALSATNAALGTANTTLTSIDTKLTGTVGVAGYGRLIQLQTTDYTLSAPNLVAHEWFVYPLNDCRSWTAYILASGSLNVSFAPLSFASLPGTEIGGSDLVATDGSHFSGWMALQGSVPVAAPSAGVILELPGGETSVTIHTLNFYCSR